MFPKYHAKHEGNYIIINMGQISFSNIYSLILKTSMFLY